MGAERDRQHVVDRLRGFALLGVLLVNAPFLLTSVNGLSDATMPHWWDRLAAIVTWSVFQAKSYVIFSFLFGYSLTILLESAGGRGLDTSRIYRQRLAALLLLGVLHATTLFVGDILAIYAVLGTLLLWLRRKRDRTVLIAGAVLFALQLAVLVTVAVSPAIDLGPTDWIDRSWREDGFLEATLTRVMIWPAALSFVVVIQGPLVASLFCIGLVAGRRKWLSDPESHRAVFERVRRWGLLLGAPLQVLAGVAGTWPGISSLPALQWGAIMLMYATAPILSAGFVAAIALLPRVKLVRLAEAEGKMSLTIYLLESLALTSIAAGWGLGCYGMATGSAFAVAIGVWCLLLGFAHWWSRRFGQGPAERVLRSLTYAGIPSGATSQTGSRG